MRDVIKDEYQVFTLKDDENNFVGINSISFDKPTGEHIYSWSERLVGGFYTYTSDEDAKRGLQVLQRKAQKIKFVKQFHIKEINMIEVMREEYKMNMNNLNNCPFKCRVIEEKEMLNIPSMTAFMAHINTKEPYAV